MVETSASVLDWFGIAVFATTGALVASRKQMDVVGFILLATATGIGGGTIRDLLLGVYPIFWVKEPAYLVTCVVIAVLGFFLAHVPQSRYRLLLWLDGVGMALFAVTGAEKALLAGTGPIVAIAMGVISATFGGIIRDILGGESSVILSREVYVSAALAGAAVFVILSVFGFSRETGLISGFVVAASIRSAALYWDWSLPRYRPRAGRQG